MNPERAIAYRRQAAALLRAIVGLDISPRAALNCWPVLGNEDPSVQCAYTILWYFEADEDRHKAELFYADAQLTLMKEVYEALEKGQALPPELMAEYPATMMAPPESASAWLWRYPWWAMQRIYQYILHIIEANPWFQRPRPK